MKDRALNSNSGRQGRTEKRTSPSRFSASRALRETKPRSKRPVSPRDRRARRALHLTFGCGAARELVCPHRHKKPERENVGHKSHACVCEVFSFERILHPALGCHDHATPNAQAATPPSHRTSLALWRWILVRDVQFGGAALFFFLCGVEKRPSLMWRVVVVSGLCARRRAVQIWCGDGPCCGHFT